MSETVEERRLQWVKGDKQGTVEIVDTANEDWTIFKSGGRISNSLINEFMISIQSDNQILNFKEAISQPPVTNSQNSVESLNKTTSPVLALLERMEVFDEIELNLKVNIKVPTIDVMNLISSTFGEGEFNKDLEIFIKQQTQEKNLNGILKKEIEFLLSNLK